MGRSAGAPAKRLKRFRDGQNLTDRVHSPGAPGAGAGHLADRRETLVTTGMVFLMVFIAAAFFFAVDQVLSFGVRLIYGLGQ